MVDERTLVISHEQKQEQIWCCFGFQDGILLHVREACEFLKHDNNIQPFGRMDMWITGISIASMCDMCFRLQMMPVVAVITLQPFIATLANSDTVGWQCLPPHYN